MTFNLLGDIANDIVRKMETGMPESKTVQQREESENEAAIKQAMATRRSVTFTAADGCEVTVTPTGYVFHNAADWW